jgi:hypothetical protein
VRHQRIVKEGIEEADAGGVSGDEGSRQPVAEGHQGISVAIFARSAFVRRRRPLGPSITSNRETPTPFEPSKWTPTLPSLSKSKASAPHTARTMARSDQQGQKVVGVALTSNRAANPECQLCL